MAVYSVEDNGVGIKPELQGAIWEQYARLDPEGSPAGNGLGLATVRRIARRHGGQAWVESSAGRGSRFFVSLPGGKR
jgi:signal transduction histidine kinase